MLADLIRAFCKEPENNYEVYENYTKSWTTPIGEETVTTIGIVVKQDQNYFEMLEKLSRYLEAKQVLDERLLELMGTDIDPFGPDDDVIVYFPEIQDYHPLV